MFSNALTSTMSCPFEIRRRRLMQTVSAAAVLCLRKKEVVFQLCISWQSNRQTGVFTTLGLINRVTVASSTPQHTADISPAMRRHFLCPPSCCYTFNCTLMLMHFSNWSSEISCLRADDTSVFVRYILKDDSDTTITAVCYNENQNTPVQLISGRAWLLHNAGFRATGEIV